MHSTAPHQNQPLIKTEWPSWLALWAIQGYVTPSMRLYRRGSPSPAQATIERLGLSSSQRLRTAFSSTQMPVLEVVDSPRTTQRIARKSFRFKESFPEPRRNRKRTGLYSAVPFCLFCKKNNLTRNSFMVGARCACSCHRSSHDTTFSRTGLNVSVRDSLKPS